MRAARVGGSICLFGFPDIFLHPAAGAEAMVTVAAFPDLWVPAQLREGRFQEFLQGGEQGACQEKVQLLGGQGLPVQGAGGDAGFVTAAVIPGAGGLEADIIVILVVPATTSYW